MIIVENKAGTARYYDGTEPHPDVKAAVEASAKLCEGLGHTIVPALNPIHGQAFIEALSTCYLAVVFSSSPAKLVQMAKKKDLKPEDVFEPWTLELAEDPCCGS